MRFSVRQIISAICIAAVTAWPNDLYASDSESPGPRFGHEMVYDEVRQEIILFGGFGPDGVPKGDTWVWNGSSWRLASVDGPSPRKWPAAAFDARRGVVILHGGRAGAGRSGPSLSDTWKWDGKRWIEVQTKGPTGRDHHRAVYDKYRDRVVLFGGWNGESLEHDTWEWNGTHWSNVALSGPSPRAPFGMVYHASQQGVVIAGGQDLDAAFSDMWIWRGSGWIRLESEVPGRRGFHAMNYVDDLNATVIFGGRDGDQLLNDMWSWDGDDWTKISSDGPVRRGIYASAYDPVRGELLIHGSGDRIDGEWVLDSRTLAWSTRSGWRVVAGTAENGAGNAKP